MIGETVKFGPTQREGIIVDKYKGSVEVKEEAPIGGGKFSTILIKKFIVVDFYAIDVDGDIFHVQCDRIK